MSKATTEELALVENDPDPHRSLFATYGAFADIVEGRVRVDEKNGVG